MKQQLNKFRQRLTHLLEKGVANGVYPGAVLLVAEKGEIVFSKEAGNLSIIPETVPMNIDTIFDLASLTKPLATTLAIMKLVNDKRIDPDQRLSELINTGDLGDKKTLILRSILSHCAGFRDWAPFYEGLVDHVPETRKNILREKIIGEPLQYPPGTRSLYSDLGFMVLEWVVESATNETLRDFVHKNFFGPIGLKRTFLSIPESSFKRGEHAATEDCPWRRRVIQGEVHDENAYALGGYSGHAGLFGTAGEVFRLADMLMGHYLGKRSDYFTPGIVREFFKRQDIVRGSTWALGWDTPSTEGSSAGRYISPNSVGHLGFSGTSIWMDLDREITVVFLSNRIHPSRNNIKIKAFRPVLHNLIFREMPDSDRSLNDSNG